MTGMIATQSKNILVNPYYMIMLGSLLGIPAFMLLYKILATFGLGAAVLSAALLDVGAALLIGSMNVKSGIELMIITVFVYIGIRIAPLVADFLI
jgi:hypothetical protein